MEKLRRIVSSGREFGNVHSFEPTQSTTIPKFTAFSDVIDQFWPSPRQAIGSDEATLSSYWKGKIASTLDLKVTIRSAMCELTCVRLISQRIVHMRSLGLVTARKYIYVNTGSTGR